MMVTMEKVNSMTKNMDKAQRMAKSETARERRKQTRETITERTMNLFSKLRRLRKKK